MNKLIKLNLITLSMLALSACGGSDDNTATAEPEQIITEQEEIVTSPEEEVVKAKQIITFANDSIDVTYNDPFPVNELTHSCGEDIEIFYSSSSGVVTSNDSGFHINGGGQTTIKAFMHETEHCLEGEATYVVNVAKAEQEPIVFAFEGLLENNAVTLALGTKLNNIAVGGGITGGSRHNLIGLTFSDENIAKVNPVTRYVDLIGVGSVDITATSPASDQYNEISRTFTINVVANYTDGMAAKTVIGQPAGSFNFAYNPAELSTLKSPGKLAYSPNLAEKFWLADTGNNRLLDYSAIPSGYEGEATSEDKGYTLGIHSVDVDAENLVVTHGSSVLIVPYLDEMPAPVYIGANAQGTGCSRYFLDNPKDAISAGGKFIVADTGNNRVLIWNTMPTNDSKEPDIVLGQPYDIVCEPNNNGGTDTNNNRVMDNPSGIWSDGERLIVADTLNKRLMFWNTFPTGDFQAADFILSGFFEEPVDIDIDIQGLKLCVADQANNRVLVWDSIPTVNKQPDAILGQINRTSTAANAKDGSSESTTPNLHVMSSPKSCLFVENNLLVSDSDNHRVMVFESLVSEDIISLK